MIERMSPGDYISYGQVVTAVKLLCLRYAVGDPGGGGLDSRIKVLIVEDHAIVREGLHSLLQAEPDIDVVGEAASGREAIRATEELLPDVVLMDISMPDMSGVEATSQIKQRNRGVKVLALTMFDSDEYFFKMLSVGASGYFVKGGSSHELVSAVRTISRGQVYFHPTVARKLVDGYLKRGEKEDRQEGWEGLSIREREIVKLIAEGHSNQEVADRLKLSPSTVQTNRAEIMTKLGLHNLSELVRFSVRRGLITLNP